MLRNFDIKRWNRFLPVILAALFLSGCIDTDDTFTINADGSGKVEHIALISLDGMSLNFGQELSDEEKLNKVVKDELKESEGVDTWSDVTFAWEGDKVRFSGTAYFKNINKLKFHNSGTTVSMYNTVSLEEDGEFMTVEIKSGKSDGGPKGAEIPDSLTDSEIDERIFEQRAEYQKNRLMVAGFLAEVHRVRRFYLPGSPTIVSNFVKEEDGSFVNDFKANKILEIMDAKMDDVEFLRKEIKAGRNIMDPASGNDESMNEMVFGKKGDIIVEVEHRGQVLFDYDAEVAVSREQFKDTAKLLGIIPEAPAQDTVPGTFRIAGVRVINFSDSSNNIRPLMSDKGYTFSIYGRLPQKALQVTKGELTAVILDTGEDILPEKDWDRSIQFPGLSKDGMFTEFQVNFKEIPPNAQRIKELSGTISFLVGGTTKDIDLGFSELAGDIKGTQFDAVIKKIGPDEWDKSKISLVLQINKSRDEIKDVMFYDALGELMDVESRGSYFSESQVTYTFASKGGEFPAKGSIAIKAYDDLKRKKISFTLNDLEIFRIK